MTPIILTTWAIVGTIISFFLFFKIVKPEEITITECILIVSMGCIIGPLLLPIVGIGFLIVKGENTIVWRKK